VNLRTVLGWIAVVFIIWYVIEAPAAAAHIVRNVSAFGTAAAAGISHFFSTVLRRR
jgi:hypothetical protein